jgi:hypothetical protein
MQSRSCLAILVAVGLFLTGVTELLPQALRWRYLCKLNQPRRNYPGIQYAVPIGDCKVLVAGGYTGGNSAEFGQPTTSCEIINVCCEKATNTGNMNVPRAEHILLLAPDSSVIAIGGITAIQDQYSSVGPHTTTVERYNRSTGQWTIIGNLLVGRRQAQARFINSNEILIVGGRNVNLSTLSSAEVFNVSTGTSQLAPNYFMPVNMHVMGVTSTGRPIIAGGRNGGTGAIRTNVITEYDRTLNTFSNIGVLGDAVRSLQILKLNDSRLLISGGAINEAYEASTQMFLENNGLFSRVTDMLSARWGHGMCQYSNDSILLFGGSSLPNGIDSRVSEWYSLSRNSLSYAPALPVDLGSFAWAAVPTNANDARTPPVAVLAIAGVSSSLEFSRSTPRDTVFILRTCAKTRPDSLLATSIADSCYKWLLSLDSTGVCVIPSAVHWSFGDGSQETTGSVIVRHSFPTAGTFTVKATWLANSCNDSLTLTRRITVTAPLRVSASPKQPVLCYGDSGAVLTATGGVRYEWRPASSLSSSVGATVTAKPTQNTKYYVRGYTADGCSSEDSVVVSVIPRPNVKIAGAPVMSVCSGSDSVSLALTTSVGVRSVRWLPRAKVACDSCLQTRALSGAPSTFIAIITDSSGCVWTDTVRIALRNSSTARINGAPVIGICKGGDSVLLSLTSPAGVRRVQWIPRTGLACDTCMQTKALPSVTTTYTAVITDTAGCVRTDSLRIQIGSGSKIMLAGGPQFICFKNDSARILVAGKVRSVVWTPSALVTCDTCISMFVKPAKTTTYRFSAVDVNGCTLDDSVTVTVLPKATVDIDPDTTLCASTPLRVSVYGTYERVDWWPVSGVICPTCPTALLLPVPGQTITYYVRGRNGNSADCDAVDSVRFRFAPGIEGQLSDKQMCVGDSVVVSLRRFGGKLSWTPALKPTCDTCTTYVLKPTKTTRYVLTGDSLGCVSRDTMDVVISPTTLRVPATLNVCEGKRVSIGAVTNADAIQWWPAVGLSCTNCASPVLTATQSRTYYVTAGRGSCVVRDSVRVVVLPTPVFSVSPIDTTVCSAQSVTVVVRSQVPGTTVVWNTNSDLSCFECDSVRIRPGSNDSWYTARISTPGGCDSLVNVRIRTVAPPVFKAQASAVRICAGDIVRLSISGDTTARYTWSAPASSLPGIACDTCARTGAQPQRTTTFIVRGQTAAGCMSMDSVRVIVDSMPRVVLTPDTSVCVGERVVLRVNGGDVVQWQANSALSCTDCYQPIATIGSTSVFRVRVSSKSGSVCVLDTSVTVTALPCVREVQLTSTSVGVISACDSALSQCTLRNSGNTAVILDSITVATANGAYLRAAELAGVNSTLPKQLINNGDSLSFAVHILPTGAGAVWVDLRLHFRDSVRTLRVGVMSTVDRVVVQVPSLAGVRPDTLITLSCAVSSTSWQTLMIKDSVLMHVFIDSTAMIYDSCSPGADLPPDWTARYAAWRSTPSHAVFELRGPSMLTNNGVWLLPVFRTLVPRSSSSSASARLQLVTVSGPCVEFGTTPAVISFTSCVLDLRQVDFSSVTSGLYAVRPNPAQGSGITVSYGLSFKDEVRITLFAADGREIAKPVDGVQSAGVYELELSTRGLVPGTYVLQLRAQGNISTLPFVVVP